jgi:hypothetical protein
MLMQAWFNTFEPIPGWALVLIGAGPPAAALLLLTTAKRTARTRVMAILLCLLLPILGIVWTVAAVAGGSSGE